ncbi:DUF3397 domain-containing protein [Bacillaceae bacterium Marseille-Q3522]|nr:DUF3397 domain-containing protein [Bacillaceae bacterium Marseille-Q3522]
MNTIISIIVIFPFLGSIFVYLLSKLLTKKQSFSIKFTLDVTAFLLIVSVHFLIKTIWDKSLFIYLVISIVCLFGLLFFINLRVKKNTPFIRILRRGWRIVLLVYFTVYIFLLIFGLVDKVWQSV